LLCLWLTGSVGKERYRTLKKRRLVASALFCAVVDAVVVIWLYQVDQSFPMLCFGIALLEMPLGVFIVFGKKNLPQNSVLLLVVTMLLSGFFSLIPIKNVGLFCLMGSFLLPLLKAGATTLFRAKQTEGMMYQVTLHRGEEQQPLKALMDTGNRLRLYGSRIPVVLVDETYLTDWVTQAEEKTPQKLVILPYKGVGGTGLLRGVRVQCRLYLEKENVIGGEVAAVAAEHKLFSGCEYQMILQPEVLGLPVAFCVKDTQEGEQHVI